MLWLMNIVKLLERKESFLMNLNIQSNPLLVDTGKISTLPYLSDYGLRKNKGFKSARFRNTKVLNEVKFFF